MDHREARQCPLTVILHRTRSTAPLFFRETTKLNALSRELAPLFFLKNSSSIRSTSLIRSSVQQDSRFDSRHTHTHGSANASNVQFMEECSVVFEELQETHAQYTVPGYLNRFSKLYESHFEAFCAAMDAEVNANVVQYNVLIIAAKRKSTQCR